MMVQREILQLLLEYSTEFRSVLLIGPRQSGKTTLAKQCFPDKPYVSLENLDEKLLAETDARAFLNRYPNGAILDEVQRVPSIFSYLQEILDRTDQDGLFILTGSNNILLQEKSTQTLAGRMGILELLPLSFREILNYKNELKINEFIFKGTYPEIYDKNRKPALWYNAYIRTYVERDVRQIKNIDNTSLFTKFLKLCAGRVGQQLNLNALSNDCGIDVKTVQAWLSLLEQTYVIKLLQPYYNNFNKRLVKAPKMYFYDTGLVCSLLGIRMQDELEYAHFKGALAENLIIVEMIKNSINHNLNHTFYYWRDNKGVEVDLLMETGNKIIPIEIKSAQTYSKDFTNNLLKVMRYSNSQTGYVVYDGEMEFESTEGIKVMNWKNFFDYNLA